ncbi:MAG: diguanylate cyclase [Armatimonas sp.]
MASSTLTDSNRLAALAAYHILDTPPEQGYDDITQLAAILCDVPICVITLLDDSRQWFKSCIGIEGSETPLSVSFCAYAIQTPSTPMIIPDALEDPRFVHHPMVTGDPYIRFYAGVPLITPEGYALGTLCVVDRMPRTLTEAQLKGLQALARQVVCLLEMRKQVRQKEAIEQLFFSALNVMQEGFLLIDRDGHIAYSNTRVEEILGLAKKQITGCEKAEAIWHEGDTQSSAMTMVELQKTLFQPRTSSLLEIRPADGESTWLWVNSCPIPQWDVTVLGNSSLDSYSVVVTLRDVTEQKRVEANLAQAHEWTNSILSSITDAFMVLDRQWRFVSVNKEAERLIGRSQEELVGKSAWQEYPEAIGATWYRQYRRAMHKNEAVAFEAFNPLNQTWNDVRAYPSAQGIAIYFRDITDKKRAEKALQESEAQLDEAQQIAQLGSFEYHLATNQINWSKGIFSILQREPELGPPTYEEAVSYFDPEDYQQLLEQRKEALRLRLPYEYDTRVRRRDGSYRWIHNRSQFFFDEQGEPLGIRGTMMDVHDRKLAESRILVSEANLNRAQALAHIGSWELDLKTFQGHWSDEMYRIYGLEPRGKDSRAPSFEESLNYVHPEDRERVRSHARTALEEEIEFRIVLPNGELRYARVLSELFRDGDGRPCLLRGTLMDVTTEKEAQLQIQEQMDQIQEANERLSALATIDGLTGLKNHRTFQEKLSKEFARSRRYDHPLALLLLDVDYFKQFNDCFGHPAGDSVLKAVGAKLQGQCRTSDMVARYGGEEFALILPETSSQGALELAERIRAAIEAGPWSERAITVSIGVSVLQVATEDEAALISAADKALYQAKALGRNCVALASVMAEQEAELHV